MKLTHPLCLCGFTTDKKPVIGGAFQMSDTMGLPLPMSIDAAKERGLVISFPHYFASAIEHGWDDIQIWVKISEALSDSNSSDISLEKIKVICVRMFMDAAKAGGDAREIGKRMRESLEVKEAAETEKG